VNDQVLIQLVTETLKVTLLIVAPLLITALVVGLTVSITQVVTSIQDMTISFVPRIIAVFAVGLFLFPWMVERLTTYTTHLISQFHLYAR
jgi:flagellar biosynthetic protein FliQ